MFEELGCTVDEPGVALEDPFPTFWNTFSIAGYTSYGHLLEAHRDEMTEFVRKTIEHGGKLTAADYSRALLYALPVTFPYGGPL